MTAEAHRRTSGAIMGHVLEACEGMFPVEQARVYAWACIQSGLPAGVHETGMMDLGVEPEDSWDFILTPLDDELTEALVDVLNALRDDVQAGCL